MGAHMGEQCIAGSAAYGSSNNCATGLVCVSEICVKEYSATPASTTSTPAPETTPASSTPAPTDCIAAWQQCGGNHHQGATCCVAGHTCVVSDEWYSQCKPTRRLSDEDIIV